MRRDGKRSGTYGLHVGRDDGGIAREIKLGAAADVLARRRALHARMRSVGLLLDFALSRDGDDMLVKVKAPEALLEAK